MAAPELRRRIRVIGEPIPDGEGTIFERAAAWTVVEQAQYALNLAVRELAETSIPARVVYQRYEEAVEEYHRLGASMWPQVRLAQQGINEQTGEIFAELSTLYVALFDAVREYRRIGGAASRAPGVGMLS